jgi:hypothetical protein
MLTSNGVINIDKGFWVFRVLVELGLGQFEELLVNSLEFGDGWWSITLLHVDLLSEFSNNLGPVGSAVKET